MEELRDELFEALRARRTYVDWFERYYDGDHPLPSPPKRLSAKNLAEARQAFRDLMQMGVTNWVSLVADAPAERLSVAGFRASGTADDDDAAWSIWQTANLDEESLLVHDHALQAGQSFVLVDPASDSITAEHSSDMIVKYQPGSRTELAAAFKSWDTDDTTYATLWTPTVIYRWQSPKLTTEWGDHQDAEPNEPNALGVVPVVEFAANRRLRRSTFGGGVSEFAGVLPIQDRINKTVFDRLATAEAQAFRQRFVIGWSPEVDEKTGLPSQRAQEAIKQSALWMFDGDPSEIKVGELGQADFTGFIAAVENDVNAMAAISKTPPHYLLGAMVNISGDALAAAESGLVAKTRKHARNFGASWESVMRLAQMRADGNPDTRSRIVWDDIEHRTWSEQVNAVVQMSSLDVPTEELWSRLPEVTPQDVQRWRRRRLTDRILDLEDA